MNFDRMTGGNANLFDFSPSPRGLENGGKWEDTNGCGNTRKGSEKSGRVGRDRDQTHQSHQNTNRKFYPPPAEFTISGSTKKSLEIS